MSGKRDITWVADTVVTQLKASLPAKFTELETEYGDSVDLEDIPTDNYFISERQLIPGFPMIAVIPENSDTTPFTGEVHYGIEYHTLTVAIFRTANEDEDVLKRQVSRTVRAVQEVILEHRTLGASVDDCIIMEKQYGPLLGAGNALLQEGQVTVRVQTSEN